MWKLFKERVRVVEGGRMLLTQGNAEQSSYILRETHTKDFLKNITFMKGQKNVHQYWGTMW